MHQIRVRRSDGPASAFARRELVGIVLAFGALTFSAFCGAATKIEEGVHRAVRRALDDANLDEVDVEVSGREVVLSSPGGVPFSARDVARSAKVSTWIGAHPAATHVRLRLRSPYVRATVSGGIIRLEGRVPTLASRDRLMAVAREFQHLSVEGQGLTLARGPAKPTWVRRAERGLAALGRCFRGRALIRAIRVDLECLTARRGAKEVLSLLHETDGELSVVVAEEAARCESELGRVLERAPLRFISHSAVLRTDSERTLDALAEVIERTCLGRLRVLGWTTGRRLDVRLGAERALSVTAELVKRGVQKGRLEPAGVPQGIVWGTPSWRLARSDERVAIHSWVAGLGLTDEPL